jgi:hypothetical protein
MDALVLSRAAAFSSPTFEPRYPFTPRRSASATTDALITYDARLARVAEHEGLNVLHPGVDRLS